MSRKGSLTEEIRALIALEGPIGLERYMSLALGHPTLGYYMTRDPFGRAGDFTTAPEISQMFGELIGLWSASVWKGMGRPAMLRLVELGPGRGTLMADALRAAWTLPGFHAAIDLHLVETSPVLRSVQARTLQHCGIAPTWHATLETVPRGPTIVLANEFFDALPVRHYVRGPRGWAERLVGLDGAAFHFGLAPDAEASLILDAPRGAILELGLVARRMAGDLGGRLARDAGAALIIDYGYVAPRFGETLQAVRAHRFVDPLDHPGEADLTAHVDFAALASAATVEGATVHEPVTQGEFLDRIGLRTRASVLRASAADMGIRSIDSAVERLAGQGTHDHPGMGDLFKALALTSAGLPVPPGFSPE